MASAVAREASLGSVVDETKVNIIILGDTSEMRSAMTGNGRQ
jgi:hypothetical protein